MTLDKALAIAVAMHAGQTDKIGEPYILHPLRIMLKLRRQADRVVAVLHDVVEDSHGACTLADLRKAGFPAPIVEAVDRLTRRTGESYEAYIRRAAGTALSRRIKIADLEDNMEFRLRNGLLQKDRARMRRYQRAYRTLTGAPYPLPSRIRPEGCA